MASGFRMMVLGGVLAAGIGGFGVVGVRAEGSLTTAEVFDMLPGSCMDDPRDMAEYETLVEQGEAIYGSLLEIVRDNTDYWVVSGALSVLQSSKGDKREAIAELRQILAARASEMLSESERRENGEAVVIESPFLPTPDGELILFVGEKPVDLERLVVMLGERIVAIDGELWPKGGGCGDGDAGKARLEEQERTVCKALLRVVKDSNWPYTVQSALALLKGSNVDRAEMAKQMKECLAEWSQGDSWTHEWMIPLFADALADVGEEGDLEALAPLLSHPVEPARMCCARRFGERGGRKELALLEEAKGNESDERILAAIEKGIAEIKSRLDGEEGGDETTKRRDDEGESGGKN